MKWNEWAALGIVVLFVIFFAAVYFMRPRDVALDNCEEAIKAQLKAPATYQQVKVLDLTSTKYITYDAQNVYGVPLRSQASCRLDGAGNVEDLFISSSLTN